MTIVLRMVSVLALAAPYTMVAAQVATPASSPKFICKGGAKPKQIEQTWRCPDNSVATPDVKLGSGSATTHAANTARPAPGTTKPHSHTLGGGERGESASVVTDEPASHKKAAKAEAASAASE